MAAFLSTHRLSGVAARHIRTVKATVRHIITHWEPKHIDEHKRRMAWSPWLFAKNRERYAWAGPWQETVQFEACELGKLDLAEECFLAPCAVLIASPGKHICLGRGASVAAECFLRGPVTLGAHVSINPRCHLDGGTKGITIGEGSRVAANVQIFAFNHGFAPGTEIRHQSTTSLGVSIGKDVWVGAGSGIVDGVTIGDHAVVGLGSVVTRDVQPFAIVAGNPARPIGDRRDRKD